ncbi:hypothetical protein [Burkholderia sp. PU8-34]
MSDADSQLNHAEIRERVADLSGRVSELEAVVPALSKRVERRAERITEEFGDVARLRSVIFDALHDASHAMDQYRLAPVALAEIPKLLAGLESGKLNEAEHEEARKRVVHLLKCAEEFVDLGRQYYEDALIKFNASAHETFSEQ